MLSRFEIEHHSRSDIVHQTSLPLGADCVEKVGVAASLKS